MMENVGLTNISNNFNEFAETSGAGAIVSGIMEIAGNGGKTKHLHDSPQMSHENCWFYHYNFMNLKKPREPDLHNIILNIVTLTRRVFNMAQLVEQQVPQKITVALRHRT